MSSTSTFATANVSWLATLKARFLGALRSIRGYATARRDSLVGTTRKFVNRVPWKGLSMLSISALSLPNVYAWSVRRASDGIGLIGRTAAKGVIWAGTGAFWAGTKITSLVGKMFPKAEQVMNTGMAKAASATLTAIDWLHAKGSVVLDTVEEHLTHANAQRVVSTTASVLGATMIVDVATKGMLTSLATGTPVAGIVVPLLAGGLFTWALIGGVIAAAGVIGFISARREVKHLITTIDGVVEVAQIGEGDDKVKVMVVAGTNLTQEEIDAQAEAELAQSIAAGERELGLANRGNGGRGNQRNGGNKNRR